jgi:hypothetical protein
VSLSVQEPASPPVQVPIRQPLSFSDLHGVHDDLLPGVVFPPAAFASVP